MFARGAGNTLTATRNTHAHDPHSTDQLKRCLCYESNGATHYMGPLDGDRGDACSYAIRGEQTLSVPTSKLLRNATASDFYDALVSTKFTPPTAMSEGGYWHRLGLMYKCGANDEEARKEMKHMLARTKSPWLSRRQQQTLYMVAVNAVPLGRRGCHWQCTCGANEDLEHVLFYCPIAMKLWRMLLPHWAAQTATQSWATPLITGLADNDCKRAIALGVRPDGQTANDEQWQTLRAIAIDALLKQHRANSTRVDNGHPPLAAAEAADVAYDDCRTELQRILGLSHRTAQQRVQHNLARPHRIGKDKASRPLDAWHAAWIASGLAASEGRLEQLVLPPRLPAANQQAQSPPPKATPPPAQLPPDTLSIFTDGSGPGRHEVTTGWGFTVVTGGDGDTDENATEVHSRCGCVVTDTQDALFIGAERATNNTAELTAIACALRYVCEDQSGRPVLLRYDSLYAGNMTTGVWRARKNLRLVQRVRTLWARAHDHLKGQLWMKHVYGHNGHAWNDRADELAELGKGGAPANGRTGGGNGGGRRQGRRDDG